MLKDWLQQSYKKLTNKIVAIDMQATGRISFIKVPIPTPINFL